MEEVRCLNLTQHLYFSTSKGQNKKDNPPPDELCKYLLSVLLEGIMLKYTKGRLLKKYVIMILNIYA